MSWQSEGRRSPTESKGEGAAGGHIVFVVFSWSLFSERCWVQTLCAKFIFITHVLHLAAPDELKCKPGGLCLMIGFCERLHLSYLGKLCKPAGRGNCSRRSSSQEGMVDRGSVPLKYPWRCPVRCSAFVSLYAPEAKSTLETQQLDSAAAIWLVSNKWLPARFVTTWSIKFRKSLFSSTADIGKDLGTCLGIEGTCWTWMRKQKNPTGRQVGKEMNGWWWDDSLCWCVEESKQCEVPNCVFACIT